MVLLLSVRWQEAMAEGIKKKTCLLARHSNMRKLIIFRFSGYYYGNIFLGIKAARYGIEFIATIVISVPEMWEYKNVKWSVANGAAIHTCINAGF